MYMLIRVHSRKSAAQINRQHQLRSAPLKRVVKSPPPIQNPPTHDQAMPEPCRRHEDDPPSRSILQSQVCRIRGEQLLRFKLRVSRLRTPPPTKRLAIVMQQRSSPFFS